MTIRLEQRMSIPRWLSPVTTIGAVIVALVISAIILAGAAVLWWAFHR